MGKFEIDFSFFEKNAVVDKKHKWGDQLRLCNYSYCLKILRLKYPHIKGSFHCHDEKFETWFVAEGIVMVRIWRTSEEEIIRLEPGDKLDITRRIPHQFWCLTPAQILEVSTKDDDKDTYRYNEEDKWFYNEDNKKLPDCWLNFLHRR